MDYIYVAGSKKVELAHYGREGMKWYQRIFGSVDPRAKYNRENIANATDDELRAFINRKNLEKQYLDNAATKGLVDRVVETVENKVVEKIGSELAGVINGKVMNVVDKLRARPVTQNNSQNNNQVNNRGNGQPNNQNPGQQRRRNR